MPVRTLVVIAKSPVPGRVKTRLCPPCTPEQAAGLARAALEDTLAAVAAVRGVDRRVIVLDGAPGDWLPPGFEVMPQRQGAFSERLAWAFDDVGGGLLVGMDTPQLTPEMLEVGLNELERSPSVFGRALDGGYWAIGLHAADPRVFAGVPMSAADTGVVQRERLCALGLRPYELPVLRDVDTIEDAHAVAAAAPGSRFAAAVQALSLEVAA